MRFQDLGANALRRFTAILAALAMLLAISPALTQDDSEEEAVSLDPVMLALDIARDLVEAERESALKLIRWRYYEDNWSSVSSQQLYGAFGIDSCVAAVPMPLKRADILFGWTFSLLDASGKEYQTRVSYDLEEVVLCDEVHVPPQYGGPTQSAQAAAPADDAGSALRQRPLPARRARADSSWAVKP